MLSCIDFMLPILLAERCEGAEVKTTYFTVNLYSNCCLISTLLCPVEMSRKQILANVVRPWREILWMAGMLRLPYFCLLFCSPQTPSGMYQPAQILLLLAKVIAVNSDKIRMAK